MIVAIIHWFSFSSTCVFFPAVGDQVLSQEGTLIVWWGEMRRELTRGGIFLCACVSAQHRDNWGGTPGHWSPLNPTPLPFKPTASTLGAHFVHSCVCVCVACGLNAATGFYVCRFKGRPFCLLRRCPSFLAASPQSVVWQRNCAPLCVRWQWEEQQVIQLCYKWFRTDW